MRAEGLWAFGCEAGQRAFNQLFITGPGVNARALQAMTSAFEHGRFRLRFRDDLGETAIAQAEGIGLMRQGGIPTMVFEGTTGGPDSMLRIERVQDMKALADHVRVVTAGFDWRPDTLGRIFTPRLLEEPDWAAWVGYEDGVPVATAQLVVHAGIAGLYYVATVEAARRRGCGEAVTRAAMSEGFARGCRVVCLQASEAGRPVYERIGFSITGEYITYVRAEDA
jgi:ribosomal protein S18 acetylase RimI-like enzyme